MSAELLVFVVITLGALGTIVKMVPDWVARLGNGFINLWEAKIQAQITALKADLAANTAITTESRDLNNGRLHAVQARADAAEREVAKLSDVLRYLSGHPEIATIIRQYQDRRNQR